jgi:hypothetical protein
MFVQQAQFHLTRIMLENFFSKIINVPCIQKQHYFQALHKNVIEFAQYSASEKQYVFRF